MKVKHLTVPCLTAAIYFGLSSGLQAQTDTTAREQKIEEVVMIGYGSQRKENVTGSIGVVSAKDLADKPNPNPVSSIQGKVSGVQIQNSGAPGGSPRIDIRGISSISGKPVFIVDGMLTDDISFLNPQDIESMSILKDPSSLAIFGARASNGAVIIKTKSGKGNKPVFNLSTFVGVKKLTNIPKMVNAEQYVELYNEKLKNEGVTDPTKYLNIANYKADTDWFDEIFGNGIINNTDISVSGKLNRLAYFVSAGYLFDEGTLAAGRGINSGNSFGKFGTRANLTFKVTDNITVGNNFTYSKINTNNSNNPVLTAYSAPPVYYPVNPVSGNYDYFTLVSLSNPRAVLDLFRSKNDEDRFMENIWGEVKFLKDFSFKVSYSLDSKHVDRYEYVPTATYQPQSNQSPTTLNVWDTRNNDYVWDNLLTWKKRFSNHNLELLGGFSRAQQHYNGLWKASRNVMYDGTEGSLNVYSGTNFDEADHVAKPDKLAPYKNRIESLFGRINYDYAGKYLLNASVRRDGSSGFSADDRYKIFPAVSVGWVVSKEAFMANQSIFSLLKLRGSWGRLGNPDVGGNQYTDRTTIFNAGAYYGGVGYPAETMTEVRDQTIGWETIEGSDFGLEMAFLNNKLKVEATYFDKDSKDVVYGIFQPVISGASNYQNYVTNAYSFNNKGFETSVNYDGKLNEKIRLGAYANLTTLKNKITDVFAGSYLNTGSSLFGNSIIRLEKGQAVGSYYGYQVVGIFQNQAEVNAAPTQNGKTVGGFKFADIDGNGVIDARDKTFLGSPIPKFTYGFGVNLGLSDFDLAIDFQGVYGNKIYNYNREQRYGNESWDLDMYENRWHGEGTSNSYPMITNNQAIILPNSFYVEDGSFFRIRNILLGYNFAKNITQSLNVQKMRLYVSAQNPFTSFKYHGFSPEILNTDRVQMGIDNNIYPISAIYTFGMNLTF